MKRNFTIPNIFCFVLLLLFINQTKTAEHLYLEDFATTQYKDTLNTTANWDTVSGELRLHPFEYTLASSYDTPGYAFSVAIAGDYAYVVDYYSLQVIDISDPSNPTFAGSYNKPGLAMGVAISGDYAYVGDEYAGLQVIDISDPTNPTFAGNYDTPGHALDVAISGDYAYVADIHSPTRAPTQPYLSC